MINSLLRFCIFFILAMLLIRFREKILDSIKYNRYYRNLASNLWMKLSS